MSARQDTLHRFLFNKSDVRGELVNASGTLQQILDNHHYPEPVRRLLGELLVCTSLLTATLKFEGDITVQIQGDGPVRLAVINANDRQQMRGIARMNGDVPAGAGFHDMIGKGFMVITITPRQGERYQGIVALEGDTLEACLDAYFRQSEQLPTSLFVRVAEHDGKMQAAGMLLQALPASAEARTQEETQNMFSHLMQLTATISSDELFTLDAETILYRLYHEEDVMLYEPAPVAFHCGCSRERCADTLVTLPEDDVNHILQEDGKIDMECEYCGAHHIFDEQDIHEIRTQKNASLH